MEEFLWRACDYGWLTNSARRPSTSNEPTRPDIVMPLSTLSPVVNVGAVTHSPDFETLLEGALSFDFGLLNQVSHQSETRAYSGC